MLIGLFFPIFAVNAEVSVEKKETPVVNLQQKTEVDSVKKTIDDRPNNVINSKDTAVLQPKSNDKIYNKLNFSTPKKTNREDRVNRQIRNNNEIQGRVGDTFVEYDDFKTNNLKNLPRGRDKMIIQKINDNKQTYDLADVNSGDSVNPYYKILLRQRILAPTMQDLKQMKEEKKQEEKVKQQEIIKVASKLFEERKRNIYLQIGGSYAPKQNISMLGFERRIGDVNILPEKTFRYQSAVSGGSVDLAVGFKIFNNWRFEYEYSYLRLTDSGKSTVNQLYPDSFVKFNPNTNSLGEMTMHLNSISIIRDFNLFSFKNGQKLNFSLGGGTGASYLAFYNNERYVHKGFANQTYNAIVQLNYEFSQNWTAFIAYRGTYISGDFENNYPIPATYTGTSQTTDWGNTRSVAVNKTRIENFWLHRVGVGLRYYIY